MPHKSPLNRRCHHRWCRSSLLTEGLHRMRITSCSCRRTAASSFCRGLGGLWTSIIHKQEVHSSNPALQFARLMLNCRCRGCHAFHRGERERERGEPLTNGTPGSQIEPGRHRQAGSPGQVRSNLSSMGDGWMDRCAMYHVCAAVVRNPSLQDQINAKNMSIPGFWVKEWLEACSSLLLLH